MLKRMSRKQSLWPTLIACSLAASSAGRAQARASAAQKAAAESLLDDGLKAMKNGHYADACPKLEESERIDPGIGTLLSLGECYERTGRTASAWATFREVASSAQALGETERARDASGRADRLQPGLSNLTLRVPPETAQLSGLRVTRDGTPIESAWFGVAIPVDPGKYRIVVSADGHENFEGEVEVGQNGDAKTFDTPALKVSTKPAVDAAGSASTRGTPGSASSPGSSPAGDAGSSQAPNYSMRGAAFITGALGVVGLGVGSYFGVRAISKNSNAESYCPRGDHCDNPRGVTLTQDAKNAAVVSNIAFAVGAAFVVTGVVLYLSGGPQSSARLEVHPIASRSVASIGLGGAFR